MPLTLAEALTYIDKGIAKAKDMNVPVAFAVVDEFCQLVQLDRMDGAPLMAPDMAEAKAVTAVNFRQPTSQIMQLESQVLQSIAGVVHFKVVALPGGVPIMRNGASNGAIGVSGGTAQQDEEIARYAIG